MASERLTKAMKLVLERLHAEPASHFEAFSTACALHRRGLVQLGGQQAGGKQAFPGFWVTLTSAGRTIAAELLARLS